MSFFVVKYIVPIALPGTNIGYPWSVQEKDRFIAQEERVNLLEREYLVSATSGSSALDHFFSSTPPSMQEKLYGLSAENGAGIDIPLISNYWYAAGVQTSKGLDVYLIRPSSTRYAAFMAYKDLPERLRESIGDLYTPAASPLDELIKTKAAAPACMEDCKKVFELTESGLPRVAFAIKAARKEWLLHDPVITNRGN